MLYMLEVSTLFFGDLAFFEAFISNIALPIACTRDGVYQSMKPVKLFVAGTLHGSNEFVVLPTGVWKGLCSACLSTISFDQLNLEDKLIERLPL